MTGPVVHIQVDPTDSPSTPSWFGEVAVVAHPCGSHLSGYQKRRVMVKVAEHLDGSMS